jgi:hypothetical protein
VTPPHFSAAVYKSITQFYDWHMPAKLIISCPPGTKMAGFACDDGIGEEQERLLRKGTRFRVNGAKWIEDRTEMLAELSSSDTRRVSQGIRLLVLRVSIP